jgi:hypothetical protein
MWRVSSVVLLLACRPECEAACSQARLATEACLAASGLDWSARGWRGPADYDQWCATVVWEAEQLERGGGDMTCDQAKGLGKDACDVVLAWPEDR